MEKISVKNTSLGKKIRAAYMLEREKNNYIPCHHASMLEDLDKLTNKIINDLYRDARWRR